MAEPPSYSSVISGAAYHPEAPSAQYRFPRPQVGRHHQREASESLDKTEKEKSSLDLTQRLERKLAEYNASQNVFKRWLFEIISWTLSATCMGAIVGIYVSINGKEMVKSEQLLTLTNLLGKVASAALIVPTSEALGQLKWNHFHSSKAMWDFEIFDKASRGPWGAALLLFRTRGRSLAALGALLIVLLLAIDTFFQQVVSYPDEWALQDSFGAIPLVKTYDPPYLKYYIKGAEQGQYDEVLAPIVKKYFYENGSQSVPFGNTTRPDIAVSCPTSRCVWPKYDTLSVCSSCQEVSPVLNITWECRYTSIDWSVKWEGPLKDVPYSNGTVCGHFLNATSTKPILLSGYVASDNTTGNATGETLLMRTIPLSDFDTKIPYFGIGSISFKDIRYPIVDVLVASAADGYDSVHRHDAPWVHECILSWCVQGIQSSYEWGEYNESVVSTSLNVGDEPRPWPWVVTEYDSGWDYIYKYNVTLHAPASEVQGTNATSTYTVWNETAFKVINIFDDFFPAFYTTDHRTQEPVLRFKNYLAGPSTRNLDFNPWLAPNNITRHMQRLATGMTNVMRSNSDSNTMLSGRAYNQEKFIAITWPWLVFPLLLLTTTLVFLICTIVKTSKHAGAAVWKTSAIPTLIYGLPRHAQTRLRPSEWNAAHERSKKVRIRLLPDLGWRVSGAVGLSPQLSVPPSVVQAPHGWI